MSNFNLNLDMPQNPDNLEKILQIVDATRSTLHENNKSLFSLRDELFQKKRLIARKKKDLSNTHDRIKNVIAEELDRNGKPKYSNETKRQAEFLMRSAEDTTCNELENQIDSLMISAAEIERRIDDLTFNQEILMMDYKLSIQLLDVFGKHLKS